MPEDRNGNLDPALFAGNARFRPLAFVGRGSMGSVYRVFDRELESVVALKMIPESTAQRVYELKQEYRTPAGIDHPNLIKLQDLVVSEDLCCFTMEFVDGPDFVEHVRRNAGSDSRDSILTRFYEAATQLVNGLAALHAAGRLHRDVKPPNVLVDPDGRVVILDFDLAAPIDELGVAESAAGELAGTIAYMAPEQLWGVDLSPATDWYAVGVVFHQALTGCLPPTDPLTLSSTAPRKEVQLLEADPPLPEQLTKLIAALLDPDPTRRPDADEILERLGMARAQRRRARVHRVPPVHSQFVGRTEELAKLRRILRDRDHPRVVEIHGESGIGKTELVRRFLQERGDESDAVLLVGRCHPQESVAFKALDAIMDSLSRYLLELDESELIELRPEHAAELARLFPVLARVPTLFPPGERAELDAMEALRRGVGAQRELLRRIAQLRHLILWIDDAQWSDNDSARLIRELLRPPFAPPLMLILSHRSEKRDRVELLRAIGELAAETSALSLEQLALEPLTTAESLKLAQRLCPPELASGPQLERLAAESGGSPFLLIGMVRHLCARATPDLATKPEDLRLGDVISSRLSELPEPERRILEVVSVSGRLAERSLVLAAAGLGERGRPLVQRLESARLVRTASIDERSYVEIYHDRIGEAVTARLSGTEISECHRDLAAALEISGGTDAEVLAHHFHGAGELPKAADYALKAAKRAVDALAFARGAELYHKALDWGSWSGLEKGDLLAEEGDALTKAGRLIEAGRRFREAAEQAPRLKALERRQQAAQHLVSGGHLDLGIEVLQALLEELGLRYPRTPRRALLAAFARLAEAVLRTVDPRGPVEHLDEEERIRIDTCFGCGHHLVDSDSPRGIYFSVVALVRALRARDPERMALSLAVVGGSISVVGGRLLGYVGQRMMRQADAIAAHLESPDIWGTIDVSKGQVLMLAGRCREALTRSDAGVKRLTEECQGHALECNVGRMIALRALEELGRMDVKATRAQELCDAAAAVGDRYAETAGSQGLAIARIACGDVAGARQLAAHGLELWTRRDFHIQHFYAERIKMLCDLYEGHPEAGWERLRQLEPALRRSELLRIALTRTDVLSLRGQLALALASQESQGREERLRACGRAVRQLVREKRADASLHAHLLRGGMASLRGEGARAVACLDEAIRIGDEAEMALRAACARLRRAELLQDADSVERARQEMIDCGVQSPERWAAIYAPGYTGSG